MFQTLHEISKKKKRIVNWYFPGGAVVKSPPANAGDTGLSPGPGRSRMPRSNSARAPQLLSLCSRAREPQLLSPHATTTEAHMPQPLKPARLEPVLHNKRSHRNEKPTHHNKVYPPLAAIEKAHTQQRRPNAAKNKLIN